MCTYEHEPFGFGLSYTTLTMDVKKVESSADAVNFQVAVTNTGDCDGKEVVQIYLSAPQGKLGRPAKELIAFAKTGLLHAGETELVELTVPVARLAAYDDRGVTGEKSCYILEQGTYVFCVGNSVRDAKAVPVDGKAGYEVESLTVVERLEEAMAPTADFQRMKPGKTETREDGSVVYELTYEKVPTRTIDLAKRIQDHMPKAIPQTGNQPVRLWHPCGMCCRWSLWNPYGKRLKGNPDSHWNPACLHLGYSCGRGTVCNGRKGIAGQRD